MSYVVLARKYRPQQFEDLVGQVPVSRTLLNAIESGRIAHAYIFSGPRGVGKTTTARLLAKCLNCESGPTMKPCNACPSCVSIAQGSSVQDVLEIDGASNRGIEQIRDLRESAKYTPSSGRYRIYIIDEAHQITKDAFGALLKTLEEPPAHVIFMMATTEVQKIPAPILSRCQRFSLRPIAPDLVLKHLKDICAKEKVKVDDSALADIVRFVEGSLRDALSLLDQAIVYATDGITSETLRQLLGLLPREVIQNAAALIAAGDPIPILKFISQSVVESGIDLTQLGKDLQDYYHTLLLIKAGVEDVFQTDLDALIEQAKKFDFPTLERNIRLLSKALDEMRRSESPRAVFEIYALKMGQKTIDPKILIEKLEKLASADQSTLSSPTVRMEKSTGALNLQNPATPIPKFEKKEMNAAPPAPPLSARETTLPRGEPPPPASGPKLTSLSEETVQAAWPKFVNAVAEQKMTLGSALEEARVSVQNGTLVLVFDKAFSQQLVNRSLSVLQPLLHEHMGLTPAIDTRVEASGLAPAEKKETAVVLPSRPAPSLAEPENAAEFQEIPPDQAEAEIQRVMKYFPGNLKKEKKPA